MSGSVDKRINGCNRLMTRCIGDANLFRGSVSVFGDGISDHRSICNEFKKHKEFDQRGVL